MDIWFLIKLLPLLFFLQIIYKFVLKPYFLCQFYKKQGATIVFKPGMGQYGINKGNVITHGEYYYKHHQLIKADPNMKLYVGNIMKDVLVTLTDAALIKDFFIKQDKYYEKGKLSAGIIAGLCGEGLIFSEGAQWKKHRKIISSIFHYEFYQDMIPTIFEVTRETFKNLVKNDHMTRVNMRHEFEKITSDLVGKFFFGDSLKDAGMINGRPANEELAEIIVEIMAETFGFWNVFLGSSFVKAGILPKHKRMLTRLNNFLAFCKQIVEKRRKQFEDDKKNHVTATGRKDMLTKLFEVQQNNEEGFMSDIEIIHEFTTFFLAGMDTTAQLCTITVCNLLQNPQYMEEARKEAEILISNEHSLTTKNINEMDFLNALMKESLRKTPPAANLFQRVALEDHMIGHVNIKKGSLVAIGIKMAGMNTKYYNEPEKYLPHRWLEKGFEADPYSFLAFSMGARNCIGQHLALIEGKIMLALLLTTFDFKLSEGYKHAMTLRFMYETLNPVNCDLTLRSVTKK